MISINALVWKCCGSLLDIIQLINSYILELGKETNQYKVIGSLLFIALYLIYKIAADAPTSPASSSSSSSSVSIHATSSIPKMKSFDENDDDSDDISISSDSTLNETMADKDPEAASSTDFAEGDLTTTNYNSSTLESIGGVILNVLTAPQQIVGSAVETMAMAAQRLEPCSPERNNINTPITNYPPPSKVPSKSTIVDETARPGMKQDGDFFEKDHDNEKKEILSL